MTSTVILPGNECTIDAAAAIYRAKLDEAKAGTYQEGFSGGAMRPTARPAQGV